jgi:hypothetical protein
MSFATSSRLPRSQARLARMPRVHAAASARALPRHPWVGAAGAPQRAPSKSFGRRRIQRAMDLVGAGIMMAVFVVLALFA